MSSLAATLGLISKLSSSIGSASSIDAIAGKLKSGAKANMYAMKVDSGEKKDWLVSAINSSNNPTIIDPNANGQPPITFTNRTDAENFIISNNLQYKYSPTDISTISVAVLMEYTPESDTNIEKMATDPEAGLAAPCYQKYVEKMSQSTPQIPSAADYMATIKQKMSTWMPI